MEQHKKQYVKKIVQPRKLLNRTKVSPKEKGLKKRVSLKRMLAKKNKVKVRALPVKKSPRRTVLPRNK